MAVTVVPEQFSMVLFGADGIRTCAEALLDRLGMTDQDVRIEVDETTPIARVQSELGDPIVVRAESGVRGHPAAVTSPRSRSTLRSAGPS